MSQTAAASGPLVTISASNCWMAKRLLAELTYLQNCLIHKITPVRRFDTKVKWWLFLRMRGWRRWAFGKQNNFPLLVFLLYCRGCRWNGTAILSLRECPQPKSSPATRARRWQGCWWCRWRLRCSPPPLFCSIHLDVVGLKYAHLPAVDLSPTSVIFCHLADKKHVGVAHDEVINADDQFQSVHEYLSGSPDGFHSIQGRSLDFPSVYSWITGLKCFISYQITNTYSILHVLASPSEFDNL